MILNTRTRDQRSVRLGFSAAGRVFFVVYTIRGLNMAKKQFASSAPGRRHVKSARYMPDSRLDLNDIPKASDEQLHRARRVGRPATGNAKQLIVIRIAPRLLTQLRRLAAKQSKPYQASIHELLELAAEKKVA
jgi:predicted DNA binding CopG/RHH family protein